MVIALFRLVLALLMGGAPPSDPPGDLALRAGVVLQVGTGAWSDDFPDRADPTRPAGARILARSMRTDTLCPPSAGREGIAPERTVAAWSPGRRGTAIAAKDESRAAASVAAKGPHASRGPPAVRRA